jgi:hypothetical protein
MSTHTHRSHHPTPAAAHQRLLVLLALVVGQRRVAQLAPAALPATPLLHLEKPSTLARHSPFSSPRTTIVDSSSGSNSSSSSSSSSSGGGGAVASMVARHALTTQKQLSVDTAIDRSPRRRTRSAPWQSHTHTHTHTHTCARVCVCAYPDHRSWGRDVARRNACLCDHLMHHLHITQLTQHRSQAPREQ